jgi:hypothetical protein
MVHIVTIGEHYPLDADDTRVTETRYEDSTYRVMENFWDEEDGPVWAVTVESPDISSARNTQDLYEIYMNGVARVCVLGKLEYELYNVDDGVSFWQKSADIDTNAN